MMDFIRAHQLNLMLLLCGACGIMAFMLFITHFLSKRRRSILIHMELIAFFLLWFDRMAYIYAGDPSQTGYIMVRVSNFLVFFLTPAVVFGFNMYLADYLKNEGGMEVLPKRLHIAEFVSAAGMVMAVISAFCNLYYYFDESNTYHRGQGFLIAYLIPVLCPLLQYTVIRQYKKIFSRLIYLSLCLYIFVPISCGILQIFTYGISIVNMAMVAVSVSLYMFTYIDINRMVEETHKREMESMQGEHRRMQRLFDQTATAFVSAVEKRDDYTKGNAVRVAEYARRIAQLCGKDEEECDKVYYTALLHDVGMIGIPDSVIKNSGDPGESDYKIIRQKPVIGKEILSSITEYPYLSQGAYYSHERYNGSGYPEGLKGEEIPEIARIVAVADAYVIMTSKKRYRDSKPDFMAREAFVKGAGVEFDPVFANTMIRIIDSENNEISGNDEDKPEDGIVCGTYRDSITKGILIENNITKVSFVCSPDKDNEEKFSSPSVIVFDSYDRKVHTDIRSIEAHHYLEYGELWFDTHSIATAARKIDEKGRETKGHDGKYQIVMGRHDDHLQIRMISPTYTKDVIMALPNRSNSAYLSITGEHCSIRDIKIENTTDRVGENDIPRIIDSIQYTDRMEADLKNIQIDTTRSASTEGIELDDRINIRFHTMSLPGATLVWHCPYIVLFYSDDGTVNGEGYKEYAFVKLNGEDNGSNDLAVNSCTMKRTKDFKGWDYWKEKNLEGIECSIFLEKMGEQIVMHTENLGISIDNITVILGDYSKVYAAVTGDMIALTDIRVKKGI